MVFTKNMMKVFFPLLLVLCTVNLLGAQDIILMKNGDEIEAKVDEISSTEIKYWRMDNLDGPLYTMKKSGIFMIKYANGTKDVFNTESTSGSERPVTGSSAGSAKFYFYRPRKISSGSAKIIVGTSVPDEVVIKLKNGSWYQTDYEHLGERFFVAGVYSLNPEVYTLDVQAGETYYVRCTVLSKGFKVMAELEMVDKTLALREMALLKEQTRSYVDR